jgi:hypothetical protein
LKEKHRLRTFNSKVLRKMFRPKRNQLKRDWKRMHNEEFHNFHSSLNIIWITKSRRTRRTVHWHVWGITGVRTGF